MLVWILLLVIIIYILFSLKSGAAEVNVVQRFYLPEEFLTLVLEGKKTQDIRPGNKNRFLEHNADYEFYSKTDNAIIEMTDAQFFESLDDLLKEADTSKLAPHMEKKDAISYFQRFYDDEKIKQSGGLWLISFEVKKK